jgi:hypothetical protein
MAPKSSSLATQNSAAPSNSGSTVAACAPVRSAMVRGREMWYCEYFSRRARAVGVERKMLGWVLD